METIREMLSFFLFMIPTGCAVRAIYCIVMLSHCDEEELPQFKKRLRHTIEFAIVATISISFFNLIMSYFGGVSIT